MSRNRKIVSRKNPKQFDVQLRNDGSIRANNTLLSNDEVLPLNFLYIDTTYFAYGSNGKKGKRNEQYYMTEYHFKSEMVRCYAANEKIVEDTKDSEAVQDFIDRYQMSIGCCIYAMDAKGRLVRVVLTATGLTAFRHFKDALEKEEIDLLDFTIESFRETTKEEREEKNLAQFVPVFVPYEEASEEKVKKAEQICNRLDDYFASISPIYKEFVESNDEAEDLTENGMLDDIENPFAD